MLSARARWAVSLTMFLRIRDVDSCVGARRLTTSTSDTTTDSGTPNFNAMVKGLPVFVGQTEASGRGLYATRPISSGEIISRLVPLVAHPTLDNLDKVCYDCLGRLSTSDDGVPIPTHGGGRGGGSAGFFCGKSCATAAWASYHAIETASGDSMAPLVRHCVQHGLKFPLVAARLAFKVLSGVTDATAADFLCHVNFPKENGVEQPPAEWLEEHAMLRVALARGMAMHRAKGGAVDRDALSRLDQLTPEWYVGVTSRLHLNAFRCEVPVEALDSGPGLGSHSHAHSHDGGDCTSAHDARGDESCQHGHSHSLRSRGESGSGASASAARPPPSPSPDGGATFRAAMEAALADAAAGVGTGSALYALPSMMNHSCDPNVDAVWDGGDATLTLRCRAAVAPGEELTITYIDAETPLEARRQRLRHAYGFTCACARCEEEEQEENAGADASDD